MHTNIRVQQTRGRVMHSLANRHNINYYYEIFLYCLVYFSMYISGDAVVGYSKRSTNWIY